MRPEPACILVGGGSSRMGRDKATIEIDGAPAWRRSVGLLNECGFDDVHLVGGDPGRFTDVPHHDDVSPGRGPLGGLVRALRFAPWVFVVAVDLFELDAASVRAIADCPRDDCDVVHARSGTDEQPLLGWWGGGALGCVERALAADRLSVRGVLGSLRVRGVEVGSRAIRNVNRPEDLR